MQCSSGSAYVFVRSGTSWSQQAKLTAGDGAEDAFFSFAVALDGDTALIGASGDDDLGSSSGSAYVFVRSGTSWSEQQKLTASDGADIDGLGSAVAVDGDRALVGGSLSESAYVFAPAETLVCVSIDDDDEGIDYRRGWHRRSHASASNGGYHRRMGNANGTTPTARLTFEGTQITYHYATSDIGGEADVYFDDVFQETISYGAGGNGPDNPTFGSSVTYSDLGEGPHTLRIEHAGGTVYVDGFEICGPEVGPESLAWFAGVTKSGSSVGVDVSAVEYRSETETFSVSALEGPIVVRFFTVDDDDVEVSVTVEGSSAEPVVKLLNPIGLLLETGDSLLGGTAAGLDEAVSSAGLYSVVIVRPLFSSGALQISVARTYEVE